TRPRGAPPTGPLVGRRLSPRAAGRRPPGRPRTGRPRAGPRGPVGGPRPGRPGQTPPPRPKRTLGPIAARERAVPCHATLATSRTRLGDGRPPKRRAAGRRHPTLCTVGARILAPSSAGDGRGLG